MDFPWNDLRTIQRFLGDPMETPDLCWTGHGAVGGSGSLRFPRRAQQQAGRSQGSGLGEASWSLRYMFFKVLNVVRTTWFSDEKSNMINMFQWFGWFWNLDHSGSGFGLTASPRSTAWGKWWRLVPAWDGSPCFGIAEMATCDSTGNRMFSISFFWVPYCKANAYFRDRSTSNNSWCWEGVLMGKRIQSTFWIVTLGVLTSAFADLCHV